MQLEETIKKIREELNRLVGTSFIRPNIALTAIMRRKGAGDYRVAIDDAALLSAIGAVVSELKLANTTLTEMAASLRNVDSDTDNLAGIKAEATAVKTNTATANTKLDNVANRVGAVDGKLTAVATNIATTNTKLDTVNTKLGEVKADTATIATNTTPRP